MAKKASEPNKSKILTLVAITIGGMLFLAGLAIVVIKVLEVQDEPLDCCAIPVERPPVYVDY